MSLCPQLLLVCAHTHLTHTPGALILLFPLSELSGSIYLQLFPSFQSFSPTLISHLSQIFQTPTCFFLLCMPESYFYSTYYLWDTK